MSEEVAGSGEGISRCTTSELVELHDFRKRLWGDESRVVDPARTTWLCVENPALYENEGPSIWICRREGRIVGADASIFFQLKFGDEECRSQSGINLNVDPQWRGRGIALAMSAALRATCRITFGLDHSVDGMKHAIRNGYVLVALVPVYGYVIQPRVLFRGEGRAKPLVRAAAPFLRVASWVAGRLARLRSRAFDLLPVDAFDARVDDIWRAVSPEYPVIVRRDAARLRWRFDESPHRSEYLRFYLLRGERAVGYVVLRATTWHDETAFKVVDYLAAPHHVGPLLACAVEFARQHGASMVGCTTLNHRAGSRIRSLGFLRAKRLSQRHQLMLYTADEDPARPLLLDAKNWFITDADSDLD
jgi:GNAT superfamily N-acetyltransferase